MAASTLRAPGVPPDYYRSISAAEGSHFLYRGMYEISATLLGARLSRPGTRLLDAGCGTGGFLRWAVDRFPVGPAAGADIASEAIELARERVPEADLRVAPLRSLPFADESFDVVVTNDVLQHVPEDEVAASLGELRRVLVRGGSVLVHTNGSRRLRRERADWRAYDRPTLVRAVEGAGFRCQRATYANMALSLWGSLRGRRPNAPSETQHGIPRPDPSRLVSAVGGRLLAAEARWLRGAGRSLPYGFALFVVARRTEDA